MSGTRAIVPISGGYLACKVLRFHCAQLANCSYQPSGTLGIAFLGARAHSKHNVVTRSGLAVLQVETARKLLSFNMAERSVDQSGMTAQALLLDYVGSSQTLRLWSINRTMMDHLHGNRMQEHMQKGKLIDEWWKQVFKGGLFPCS